MKKVKTVQIPLNILLRALRNHRHYIFIEGIRINVPEMALTLIMSLVKERDDAEMRLRDISTVVLDMMPQLGTIMALALPADFDYDAGSE